MGRIMHLKIFVAILLLFPFPAFADILVSQTDSRATKSNDFFSSHMQALGTGLSGYPGNLIFYASRPVAGTNNNGLMIGECSDSNYDDCVSVFSGNGWTDDFVTTLDTTATIVNWSLATTSYSFNPSKYYVMNISGGINFNVYGSNASSSLPSVSPAGSGNCGTTGIPLNAKNCMGNDPVKQMYFVFYSGDGTGSGFIPDDVTQIITFEPGVNDTQATSSTFLFQYTGIVTNEDWDDSTELYFRARQITGFGKWGNGEFGQGFEESLAIDAPGSFNVSINEELTHAGDWQVVATIRKPEYTIFGFTVPFFYEYLYSQTYTFIAATTTDSDHASAQILFLTTGFTTAASSTEATLYCHVSVDFNIRTCLSWLFIPNTAQMDYVLTSAKDGFLSAYPWGYVTRLATIALDSSTSTLPVLTISTPHTVNGTPFPVSGSLEIDLWSALPGSGSSYFDTRTDEDGDTFRDVAEPYWESFILLCFGLMLIPTILGIGLPRMEDEWQHSETYTETQSANFSGGRETYTKRRSRRI